MLILDGSEKSARSRIPRAARHPGKEAWRIGYDS